MLLFFLIQVSILVCACFVTVECDPPVLFGELLSHENRAFTPVSQLQKSGTLKQTGELILTKYRGILATMDVSTAFNKDVSGFMPLKAVAARFQKVNSYRGSPFYLPIVKYKTFARGTSKRLNLMSMRVILALPQKDSPVFSNTFKFNEAAILHLKYGKDAVRNGSESNLQAREGLLRGAFPYRQKYLTMAEVSLVLNSNHAPALLSNFTLDNESQYSMEILLINPKKPLSFWVRADNIDFDFEGTKSKKKAKFVSIPESRAREIVSDSLAKYNEMPECPICFHDLFAHSTKNEEESKILTSDVFETSCKHHFHHRCIQKMIESSSDKSNLRCPVCRARLSSSPVNLNFRYRSEEGKYIRI